jgi:hypothetical protein
MGRARKEPSVILALSPADVAASLGISTKVVADALADGSLGPLYITGAKRRLLIEDVTAWVRSWAVASPRNTLT